MNALKEPLSTLQRLQKLLLLALIAGGLFAILNFGTWLGGHFETPNTREHLSFALLFIAGTLTGFHCAGMCGSLVVGYTVQMATHGHTHATIHLLYGLGKTLSYVFFGALFGALGGFITFTPTLRGWVGLGAGLFLLLYGISSLHLFPALNRFGFRPPAFFMRWLGQAYRKQTGPFFIGLLNGLMVICGPLQAMYIMAAGTGSPIEGAKMLLAFGLGTLPLMMGFGFLTSQFSRQLAPKLVRASGIIVILLGLIMISRGYSLISLGVDQHDMGQMATARPESSREAPTIVVNELQTMIHAEGPVASAFKLKAHSTIDWTLDLMTVSACGTNLKLSQEAKPRPLKAGENQLRFKTEDPGHIDWQCENPKTRGTFEVVEAAPVEPAAPSSLIEELMVKSNKVIDQLRQQLHPMMHGF